MFGRNLRAALWVAELRPDCRWQTEIGGPGFWRYLYLTPLRIVESNEIRLRIELFLIELVRRGGRELALRVRHRDVVTFCFGAGLIFGRNILCE